jgi:hypothetical protein
LTIRFRSRRLPAPARALKKTPIVSGYIGGAAFYLSGVAGAQHLRLVTGISKFGD